MGKIEKVQQFTKALGDMSYCRAGWDCQLSPDRRAEENRQEKEALAVARSIWAENPGMQDDLRAAFKAFGPLATMDEIENLPIKAAPDVRRTPIA